MYLPIHWSPYVFPPSPPGLKGSCKEFVHSIGQGDGGGLPAGNLRLLRSYDLDHVKCMQIYPKFSKSIGR